MDIQNTVKNIRKRVLTLSRYTTTINDIITHFLPESYKGKDYSLNELVQLTHEKFFNFDYYFYTDDKQTKDEFEMNFLLKYINDYIGYETLGMFKARLMSHLNINMLWYEKMYNAIIQGDNPFQNNSDITERTQKTGNSRQEQEHTDNEQKGSKNTVGTGKTTSNGKSNSRDDTQDIHSDNPQVTVKNTDYASQMDRGTATNESNNSSNVSNNYTDNEITENKNTNVRNSENNFSEDITEKVVHNGLNGMSRSDAIEKYSHQIFNLNQMLIDSCSTMFLKVW